MQRPVSAPRSSFAGIAWSWPWAASFLSGGLLAWTSAVRGFHAEHWLAGGTLVALAWLGERARRLSLLALPFFLTGIAYELFPAWAHLRGEVRVAALHDLELRLFGIDTPAGQVVPAHFLDARPHVLLDALCGFAYMAYLAEVLGVAVVLWFLAPARAARLGWAFFGVTALGIAAWLAYPAAPPWYVAAHGLGPAQLDAAPSAAGAARFDALLGIDYFRAFYARNVNIFGALPSLHVAYPTVAAAAIWPLGRAWRAATCLFVVWVALSAVYLNHHYVLDVLAGLAAALVAHVAVGWVTRWLKRDAPQLGGVHG